MSFFGALFLPWRAWRAIRQTPALWRLSVLSACVCALTLIGLLVSLMLYAPALTALLWPKPSGLWLLLWYPMLILVFALCFVVGAQVLPVILLAPLGDRLSAEAERTVRPVVEAGGLGRFVRETLRAVRKGVVRVTLLLGGQALLFPLWLLPGAGHVAWSVLSTFWSILWLAFEYVDLTANRHDEGFRDVLRLLRTNGLAALGLGATIYLLLFVPVLNAFFFPIAVVSGALWYAAAQSRHRL